MVLRELRVQWRYPLSMINLVLLTPLYEMAIPTLLLGTAFMVDSSAVGLTRMVGTEDLAAWVGLGVLVASVLTGAVRGVSGMLQSDRQTGALEHSWASPASREAFVLGAVGAGTIFTAAASALLLAFAIGVLGADYDPTGVLLSVPVAGALLVGNCGFGYLAAAAALVLRRPGPLLDPLTGLVAAFSGVAFPLTVLPEPVRWLTYVLPSTWSLDLMRCLTLDTRTLVPMPYEVTALVVTSLGFLLFGRRVFRRAERKVQTTGALTQF